MVLAIRTMPVTVGSEHGMVFFTLITLKNGNAEMNVAAVAYNINSLLLGNRQFISDDPPNNDRDAKLLSLADQILCAFGETSDRFDDKDYPDTPKRDYESKRKEVSRKFKDYGYYNLPDNIHVQLLAC